MIDYSKIMKPRTVYDWEIKRHEDWEKKREQEKKEAAILREKLEMEANKRTEKFVEQFKKHLISEEMIKQLRKISPANRKRVDPVYILDKQLDIVAVVESKNLVGTWLYKNGYSKKALGRTTIFEYIRNRWEYKNMFYFVEAKNFEEFIKNIA
ncbi:TPA: hypothetical protein ACLBZ1_002326 [Bacillus cereus]